MKGLSKTSIAIAAAGFIALIGRSVTPASAGGNFTVGSCPGGTYPTIQDGVNAAQAAGGGNVNVCPGTYPEQVTITGQVNLQGIQSGTMDAAVIVPPSGGLVANATDFYSSNSVAAQLFVKDVTQGNANVSNLVVDGSGTAGNGINSCSLDPVGIFYQNSSGTINGVTARNQVPGSAPVNTAPLGGCQTGLGIWIQSASAQANTQVQVQNSSIHDFAKNAMEVDGAGTKVQVQNNSVVGAGPTTVVAQNGIQIDELAQGQVKNNLVIDLDYTNPAGPVSGDTFATGILIIGSSNIQVQQNNVGNVQEAIFFGTDPSFGGSGDHGQAQQNVIAATSIDGDAIDLCSNNDSANNNSIFEANGESAIHFDSLCGSTGNDDQAKGNTITEADVGVLSDVGTTMDQATGNNFFGVVATATDPAASSHVPSPHK